MTSVNNKSMYLNVSLSAGVYSFSTTGITISLDPSAISTNIGTLKFIIVSMLRSLNMDISKAEELLSESKLLLIQQALEVYTDPEGEFEINYKLGSDGKLRMGMSGSMNINLFNLFRLIDDIENAEYRQHLAEMKALQEKSDRELEEFRADLAKNRDDSDKKFHEIRFPNV